MNRYVATKIIECITTDEKARGLQPEHIEVEMFFGRPFAVGVRSGRTGRGTDVKKQESNDRASVKRLRR